MGLMGLIIMAMFDIIAYILVSRKMIGYKNVDKFKWIFSLLLFSFVMALSRQYLVTQYYIVIISGFLVCTMFFILYRKRIIEIIYMYLFSTVIILLIQFIVASLLELLGGDLEYSFINGLVNQSITLILISIIVKYIPISIMFDYLFAKNRVFKYLLLNIFVILISVWFYWLIDMDGILNNIIGIFILSTGMIYINLIMLREEIKREHEEKQMKIYEDYLPVIDELMVKLRAKQHEFDNHIQALYMLGLTNTNYEDFMSSMKAYIDELKYSNDLSDLIKLDNKILAGFLYSKIKKAKEIGVEFEIIIEDYGFRSQLKDYELIEVVGNLINNGFETEAVDNVVVLKLKKEKDMDIIEIRNKHPYLELDYITKMFNKGFSTKSNISRGYGLCNIKKIVNRYNEEIEVFNEKFGEDNYIVFRILFSGK